MSFDYDKMKRQHADGAGTYFASGAGLFASLSFVFLFVAAFSMLRAGVSTLAQPERARPQAAVDAQAQVPAPAQAPTVESASAPAQVSPREALATRLTRAFEGSGLDVAVDPATGDVSIGFGGAGFARGSTELDAGASRALAKAMPIYARAVFADPMVASRVEGVEIVGFASLTSRGKPIDPAARDERSRRALEMNVQLSLRRAQAMLEQLVALEEFDFKHELAARALPVAMDVQPGRKLASQATDRAVMRVRLKDEAREEGEAR